MAMGAQIPVRGHFPCCASCAAKSARALSGESNHAMRAAGTRLRALASAFFPRERYFPMTPSWSPMSQARWCW